MTLQTQPLLQLAMFKSSRWSPWKLGNAPKLHQKWNDHFYSLSNDHENQTRAHDHATDATTLDNNQSSLKIVQEGYIYGCKYYLATPSRLCRNMIRSRLEILKVNWRQILANSPLSMLKFCHIERRESHVCFKRTTVFSQLPCFRSPYYRGDNLPSLTGALFIACKIPYL